MAKSQGETGLAFGELRIEMQPGGPMETKFAVVVAAHVVGENVIVSFGQIDPIAIVPGQAVAANTFDRIAMGRATFELFIAQSLSLLAKAPATGMTRAADAK